MNNSFVFTIVLFVLAVVIILRLGSVLGRRTGAEKPPFNPYSGGPDRTPDKDKVIALPRSRDAQRTDTREEIVQAIKTIAPEGSTLSEQLKAVAAADKSFDPGRFLAGARQAYEIIVTAFADGDRRALKPLLSREVNDGFVAAIAEREKKEQKIEFKFVGVQKADITEAALRDQSAHITVRFLSSLISATKDKAGAIVDGDPAHVAEVTDIWTFARDVNAADPNWKLVATESVD